MSTPPSAWGFRVASPRHDIQRGPRPDLFVRLMGGRIPIPNDAAYNAAKLPMCGFAETNVPRSVTGRRSR